MKRCTGESTDCLQESDCRSGRWRHKHGYLYEPLTEPPKYFCDNCIKHFKVRESRWDFILEKDPIDEGVLRRGIEEIRKSVKPFELK